MADRREPLLRRLGAAGAARNAEAELSRRTEDVRRTEQALERLTVRRPSKPS